MLDLGFWLTFVGLIFDIVGAFTLTIFDRPWRGRDGLYWRAKAAKVLQSKLVDWVWNESPKFANLDNALQMISGGETLERGSPEFNDLNKIVFGGEIQPIAFLVHGREIVSVSYDKEEKDVVFNVEATMLLDEADDHREPIRDVERLCNDYTRQRITKAGAAFLISGFGFLFLANLYRGFF